MIGAKVTGIPDLREALRGIVPKLRVRALRNALAAGAREVQKAARVDAPVISTTDPMVVKGYRKPGTLRKAISVRTSKLARQSGNVGVFVNVKPAKRGNRGAKNPNDPFYWRFVHFGHKTVGRYKGKYTDYRIRGRGRLTGLGKRRKAPLGFVVGKGFLYAGAYKLGAALGIFVAKIGPAIEKLNKPKAPAP
jgi:hypothetical protein